MIILFHNYLFVYSLYLRVDCAINVITHPVPILFTVEEYLTRIRSVSISNLAGSSYAKNNIIYIFLIVCVCMLQKRFRKLQNIYKEI